jgi:hypothetical protein
MLYDLPAGPDIVVVGPDDTGFWAELGEDPAGRHALVIGDATAPHGAVVIAGPLPVIGAYLHPLHAALTGSVQSAYAGLTPAPGNQQPREHPAAPDPSVGESRPAVDVVTLPHTGIRVPDPGLRVSSYRELPTPDGVAYTATAYLHRVLVGTIHNGGNGGPTSYFPDSNVFGRRQLADFVAASRTADGQPITEEQLLDELVTFTDRRGPRVRSGLRLCVAYMSVTGRGNGTRRRFGRAGPQIRSADRYADAVAAQRGRTVWSRHPRTRER